MARGTVKGAAQQSKPKSKDLAIGQLDNGYRTVIPGLRTGPLGNGQRRAEPSFVRTLRAARSA